MITSFAPSRRVFASLTLCASMLTNLVACTNDDPEEAAVEAQAIYLEQELDGFVQAVTALQAAAPPADADGWNATADAAAVATMQAEWKKARLAYERVESSVATFFADLDVAVDERYDGFIEPLPEGDTYLFDAQGVKGMHAIERILWADRIAPYVVDFESKLHGYRPAAFPQTQQEATDFRVLLAQQLIVDATTLRDNYRELAKRLDMQDVYMGVFDSMAEQTEKIDLTATGEAESRYANHTLADMKANLEGGKKLYNAFSAWVRDQENGKALNDAVVAGFARLDALYLQYPGETMPDVPPGWDREAPSAEHLQTPYGKLWQALNAEVDLNNPASMLSAIVAAGQSLGFEFGLTPGA